MSIQGYQLASQQQRLWALHGREVGDFLSCARLRFPEASNSQRLRLALERLMGHSEILRTAYVCPALLTVPQQVLMPEARLAWHEAETAPAFDLERGQVLQAICTQDQQGTLLELRAPALALDARSLALLSLALERALSGGRDDAEALQFIDYAQWQEDVLADPENASGRSYWQRLAAERSELLLPPERRLEQGGRARLAVALDARAQRCQPERLRTLFFALLGRLSAAPEIEVTVALDGRVNEDLTESLGAFTTPLPLRLAVAPSDTVAVLEQRISDAVAEAQDQLELFDPAVARSPHAIVYEFLDLASTGKVQVEALRSHHTPSKLALFARRQQGELCLELDYDTRYYSPVRIARLSENLATLMASAQPTQTLDQLLLLHPDQRQMLCVDFNASHADYPVDLTLHELIERQVAQSPSAVAVSFNDQVLTYAELEAQANRLAHHLRGLGIVPGARVGVFMERRLSLPAVLLGVLKCGAAYVPMAANYPADRVAFMIGDAGLDLLIAETRLCADITAAVPLFAVERLSELDEPQSPLGLALDPGLPAYIIYTSGSTGKPKGVVCHHRGIVNYLHFCASAYGTSEGQGAAVHSAISFDLTLTSIFTPLLAGKRVVMVEEGEGIDNLMFNLRQNPHLSLLKLTPAHLNILNQWITADEPARFANTLVLGGEALAGESLQLWYKHAPQVRIVNEYGPTETVVGCCVYIPERGEMGNLPIGRPTANMQLYVLDRHLCPVAFGEVGELYIGGDGLASGYLGRRGLTATRFVPNPFAMELQPAPGRYETTRLYRTGDLARFIGEGQPLLEFLGRNDHQIKIRGYRIEPGEIESALRGHADIDDAIVIAWGDHYGARRLVAYLRGSRKPSTDEMRSYLADRLPDYMVPTAFVFLEQFPLTPNGKVDLAKLPAPDHTRPNLDRSYVPPRHATDAALVQVWSEVLAIEQVGIQDNFFSLGGDSIKCLTIAAKARELGVELTVPELFRHPTIEALADLIISREGQAVTPCQRSSVLPFALISSEDRRRMPADVVDAFPLGAVQLGMIFHMLQEKDNPNPPDYHNVNTFFVRMPFEPVSFQAAVDRVVAAHDILRTYFDLENYSEPLQLVQRSAKLNVGFEDLRHLGLEAGRAAVDAYIFVENHRLMPLDVAPLMRLYVHWLEDDLISLTLTEPHSAADGWSTHMSLIDIFQNAIALIKGRPLPEPERLVMDYRDFIALERETIDNPETQGFWRDIVARCRPTVFRPLPSRFQPAAAFKEHKFYFHLTADVSDGLRRVANVAGVPLKSVILAGHLRVLAIATGNRDVTAGLTFNGRLDTPEGDRIRGLFLNTLPFPHHFEPCSWLEFIQAIYRQETEMMPHRRYPIGLAQKDRREPLFVTGFSYHHFHSIEKLLKSDDFQIVDTIDASTTNYDFMLLVNITPDDRQIVSLILEGQQEIVNKDQLRAMFGFYDRVFGDIIANPHRSWHEHDYLAPSERQRLLGPLARAAATTQRAFDLGAGLVNLLQSDMPALRIGARSLSGRQLAAQLARCGLLEPPAAGSSVAFPFEPTPFSLAALLALLEAGCAPLALLPQLPAFVQRELMAERGCTLHFAAEHSNLLTGACWVEPTPSTVPLLFDPERWCLDHVALLAEGSVAGRRLETADVRRLLTDWIELLDVQPGQRVVLAGVLDNPLSRLAVLAAGACLCLPEAADSADGLRLAEFLDACEAELVVAETALLKRAFTARWRSSARQRLFVGPDPLSCGFAGELMAATASLCQLTLLDGAWSPLCMLQVSASELEDRAADAPLSLGQLRPGHTRFLLDPFGQPVPITTPGRLVVGGHLGPWAPARSVVDNYTGTGLSLYDSGLRASYLPDGSFEFEGRAQDFVPVAKGFAHLGQLASVALGHPLVLDAVTLYDAQAQAPILLASVADEAFDSAALQRYLRKLLPDYTLPRQVLLGRALPLNRGLLSRGGLAHMLMGLAGGAEMPPCPFEGEGPFSAASTALPLGQITPAQARQLFAAWARTLGQIASLSRVNLAVMGELGAVPLELDLGQIDPSQADRFYDQWTEQVSWRACYPGLAYRAPRTSWAVRLDGASALSAEGPVRLELVLGEQPQLNYDAGRFERDDIALLIRCLMANFEERFNCLAEDRRMLQALERTEQIAWPAGDLLARFDAQVQCQPHKTALRIHGHELDYATLDRQASALALRLLACGAAAEVPVAILLERTVELVVTLLAVAKTGAYYIPLDPAYPVSRLDYMLANSGARLIICNNLPSELDLTGLTVVDPRASGACGEQTLPSSFHPQTTAYVLYTSGSTGRPKGVAIGRYALASFLTSAEAQLNFTAQDVLLAVTTVCFDISGLELYLPLIAGGTLVLGGHGEHRDGDQLARTLEAEAVTFLQATPMTWQLLLNSNWAGSQRLAALCGGEAMPRDLAVGLIPKVRQLFNLYGPTEATIWVALRPLELEAVLRRPERAPVAIGGLIQQTCVQVCDGAGRQVPAGLPGELLIGGVGLARGYFNRPALTAERFVPDPFGSAGQRLYRTGDMVRLMSNGTFEFLGRGDDQIKLRGYRIELGEIEAILRRQPGIRDAAVRVVPHYGAYLAAYLVADSDLALDPLRQVLARELPDYMVPARFMLLEQLPRTLNGKLDRKALPLPDGGVTREGLVACSTATERQVAELFRELLGLHEIGRDDHFFELGGHSLTATRLLARLGKLVGQPIPVRALFDAPRVAELAAYLDQLVPAQTEQDAFFEEDEVF